MGRFSPKLEEKIEEKWKVEGKKTARETRAKPDLAEKEKATNRQIAKQRISTLEKVVGNNSTEPAKLTTKNHFWEVQNFPKVIAIPSKRHIH